MKREDLFFALNETTHALRFAEAAASRFRPDASALQEDSGTAASVAFINHRLADAQTHLSSAKDEIGRLTNQNEFS